MKWSNKWTKNNIQHLRIWHAAHVDAKSRQLDKAKIFEVLKGSALSLVLVAKLSADIYLSVWQSPCDVSKGHNLRHDKKNVSADFVTCMQRKASTKA